MAQAGRCELLALGRVGPEVELPGEKKDKMTSLMGSRNPLPTSCFIKVLM